MKDTFNSIIQLFDALIFEAENSMFNGCVKGEQICVTAPQFLIDLFREAITSNYPSFSYTHSSSIMYRGYHFIPTYLNEVAVFHKDYPLLKQEWMIRKLSLMPPYLVEKNPDLTKIIFDLQPFLKRYIDISAAQLN